MEIVNFYSGPSILPKEVIEQAKNGLVNFADTGLSILEISHRSKEFVAVMEECVSLAKKLMNLGEDYDVIFMQGGASSQFHLIPQNFLSTDQFANYIDTGTWANAAFNQAKLFGKVHLAASSADKNYNYIPKSFDINSAGRYLHITTNNTIFGTQYHFQQSIQKHFATAIPMIADMSSDILSRDFNYTDFDLIYAGAQKNIGTSGTTLVAIKKSFLETSNSNLPAMCDYKVHVKNGSMKNTPAVFPVYITYLTLKWIEKTGLQNIFIENDKKARLLYECIDSSSLYKGTVDREDRSKMNVCFVMNDKNLEQKFSAFAKEKGIVGIEGHRSVGGFRASIYNAMPLKGVMHLIDIMKEFEQRT